MVFHFFFETISLCSQGWPFTHRDPSASAGIQGVCPFGRTQASFPAVEIILNWLCVCSSMTGHSGPPPHPVLLFTVKYGRDLSGLLHTDYLHFLLKNHSNAVMLPLDFKREEKICVRQTETVSHTLTRCCPFKHTENSGKEKDGLNCHGSQERGVQVTYGPRLGLQKLRIISK